MTETFGSAIIRGVWNFGFQNSDQMKSVGELKIDYSTVLGSLHAQICVEAR